MCGNRRSNCRKGRVSGLNFRSLSYQDHSEGMGLLVSLVKPVFQPIIFVNEKVNANILNDL